MNTVLLVGRLTKDPEIKELESGTKVANISIAVNRNFKNANGEYETDFFNVTLWQGIAENTTEYCHKGDIVGIKARLQNNNLIDEEGKVTKWQNEIIAEKVTFLSSNNKTN